MIFDILKAFFIIGLTVALFPDVPYLYSITGVACILGHMFPFYLGFKGGKGLACLGGMILAFNWKVFVVMLLLELVLAIVIDYLCVVPITASIAYPAVYGLMSGNLVGALIILVATAAMVIKHLENLKRIRQGTELHFSYLWRKDKESEKARILENVKKIDETQVGTIWRDNK